QRIIAKAVIALVGPGAARAATTPRFALFEQPLESVSKFVGDWLSITAALSGGRCFDCLTDRNDCVKRWMRALIVRKIFLVSFNGFQQMLRSRFIGEIITRVTMQLLDDV